MFYYGIDLVDVVRGDGPPPSLILALVRRLPDDSLTAALMRGGREHLGWGMDRHIWATIYDALNANTRLTGQFKKGQAPKFEPWPRPGDKGKKRRRRDALPKKGKVAALFDKLQAAGAARK